MATDILDNSNTNEAGRALGPAGLIAGNDLAGSSAPRDAGTDCGRCRRHYHGNHVRSNGAEYARYTFGRDGTATSRYYPARCSAEYSGGSDDTTHSRRNWCSGPYRASRSLAAPQQPLSWAERTRAHSSRGMLTRSPTVFVSLLSPLFVDGHWSGFTLSGHFRCTTKWDNDNQRPTAHNTIGTRMARRLLAWSKEVQSFE
jgi:hypothetical protein